MRPRSLVLTAMVASTLALTGCGMVSPMYSPQLAEVPLIAHRGDTRASVAVKGIMGLDATLSTGITNHLALQLYGSVHDEERFYHHTALGYYTSGDHFAVEGYLGLGYGHGHVMDLNDGTFVRGTYMLPFAQVNLGWRNLSKAHIDCGIALKYGRFFPIFDISQDHYDLETDSWYTTYEYSSTRNQLIEPQVFFRIGGERVKYSLQIGYSRFLTNDNALYHSPLTIAMGATFFL